MTDSSEIGGFLAGMAIGGLVGAAAALLLAPQSGAETRTMIYDKSIELKDRAVEYGQDARARAEAALEQARLRADQALAEVRARADDLARVTSEWANQGPPKEAPLDAGGDVAA